MCEFISWIELDKEVYFLQNADLDTKEGKKLLKPDVASDLCGHGAIRAYYPELKEKGINKECTDFSTPDNFPKAIVEAFKAGKLSYIGICADVLTATAFKQYEAVTAPAWKQYKAVEAPAWKQYEAVTAPAWKQYEAVTATALKQYEAVTATALKQYEAVTATALKQYEAVKATALKQYEAVKATALKQYEAVRDTARKQYEAVTAPARKQYKAVEATAFSKIVRQVKNRVKAWR